MNKMTKLVNNLSIMRLMSRVQLLPKLIALFLLLKFFYLVFAVSANKLGFSDHESSFTIKSYTELSMRKDAFWYKQIAINDYPKGQIQSDKSRYLEFSNQQSEWAFFPFYPLSNKAISHLLSTEYEISALISSLLFSILAIIGFYLFCQSYFNDSEKAFWSTVVIFIFPFHFYFSMFLTEAPFLACLAWAFFFISKKRLILASIVIIPLVLLRPNGLFLLLPIFLYYLEKNNILNLKHLFRKEGIRGMAIFIPAIFSFFLFILYQHQMTGHYFAFSEAQQGWGKNFMFPLSSLFRQGDLNYQATSWYSVGIILFFIINFKRFSLSFKCLILISLLLPLTSGSTYSIIRYLSIAFPIFLVLSEMIFNSKYRLPIISSIFILHFASFYLWLIDHPLGF